MKAESTAAVLVMSTILLSIGKGAGVLDITWVAVTALLWIPAVGAAVVITAWIILAAVKDFVGMIRGD